jgi:hypothetical protein
MLCVESKAVGVAVNVRKRVSGRENEEGRQTLTKNIFSRFLGRVGAGRDQISMRGQIRSKTYDFLIFSGSFHMTFSDTRHSAWSSLKTFLE